MPDQWYVLSAILIAAALTWMMRAAPFAMIAPLRDSDLMTYVGERMPVGIMVILAVYTVRDVDLTVLTSVGPTVVALAVTVALQLWRSNAIVSIFTGTAVYVALASTLAAAA